jgi:hypothetical protein
MQSTNEKLDFKQLVDKLVKEVKSNTLIQQKLQQIATSVYTDATNKAINDGYCMSFKIPEKEVKQLIDLIGIDVDTLKELFEKEFGFPKNSKMYGNEYYQILILLYYVFKKARLDKYAKLALFLILIRLWNGRKYKYIKYCNKSVMDYVINQKLSNRNLAKKYKSPLDLIVKYFIDTIDSKYGAYVLSDYKKLKLFFNQCFVRIDQLFNNAMNTGLANLYFKSHESGEALHTAKTVINNQGESELTITDIESRSSQINKISELVASNIALSTNIKYPRDLINYINKKTKLSINSIETLSKEIHNPIYKDKLQELIVILLNRIGMYEAEILCSNKNLIDIIDKSLISSKHNKDVEEFKRILKEILDDILKRKFGKTVDDYSNKVAILRAAAYLIAYNIINTVCTLKHH